MRHATRVAKSYGFVYDARTGHLDHALLSPVLAGGIAGAVEWRSNADEAGNVGYRDANVG